MRKLLLVFVASFFIICKGYSQIDTESLIDNAMAMVQKGDNKDIGRSLDMVSMGLKNGIGSSEGIFKDKLIGQLANLGSITTALKSGVVDRPALGNSLGILKTMVAAQNLSGLIKGNNLVGNVAKITSAIAVIKGGLSLLNKGKEADTVANLLDKVSGKANKFEGKGLFKKIAQNAAKKKMGKALDMLNGLI